MTAREDFLVMIIEVAFVGACLGFIIGWMVHP